MPGPRQAGKTTLVETLLRAQGMGTLRRLDDRALREAAVADPVGFVASGDAPVAIDEVQLGGDALVRAIKEHVDKHRTAGQFILTGSANFLMMPNISESLAGRAEILELWPMTQGELAGSPEAFIDNAFRCPGALTSLPSSSMQTPD